MQPAQVGEGAVGCLGCIDIRCQRTNFLHKATTDPAKTKSVIVIEDLYVQGMIRNRHLAQSIAGAGWSEFRRMLEYKTTWYGPRLVVAPRFYASAKTCSACGHVKTEIPLSERVFQCEAYGVTIDRDLNAARNLASLVAGSSPKTLNACGTEGSGQENRLVKPAAAKQETAGQAVKNERLSGEERCCKLERVEALEAWAVHEMARVCPTAAVVDLLQELGYRCPPKKGRKPERFAAYVVRFALRPAHRDVIVGWARAGWRKIETQVAKGPAAVAAILEESPGMGPLVEFMAAEHPGIFAAALAGLPQDLQAHVEEATADALAEVERIAAEGEARQRAGREARTRVDRAVTAAEEQRERARAEAMRQRALAVRATTTAGTRIALAEKRLQLAQAEVARLQALLAERDEQVGRLVADFERRLALLSRVPEGEARALPLAGHRVLVLGDPNRAVAYQAEAVAMGAESVVFVNGMALAGERLAAAARAASAVVLVTAFAKHSTQQCARKHLSEGASMILVPQAGMRAFRDAVATAMASRSMVV